MRDRTGWGFGDSDNNPDDASDWAKSTHLRYFTTKDPEEVESEYQSHEEAAGNFDWSELWPDGEYHGHDGDFDVSVRSPEGEIKSFRMTLELSPSWLIVEELNEGGSK